MFDVLTEIDTAASQEDQQKAVKKFYMIYRGTGRAFLNPKMFSSLRSGPFDYVIGCVEKRRKPDYISDCSHISANQSVAGFAKIAREELAQNWTQDFSQIGAEDPWIPTQSLQSN